MKAYFVVLLSLVVGLTYLDGFYGFIYVVLNYKCAHPDLYIYYTTSDWTLHSTVILETLLITQVHTTVGMHFCDFTGLLSMCLPNFRLPKNIKFRKESTE